MKFLRLIGGLLLLLVVLAAVWYPLRRDPVAIVAGKALTGTEEPFPASWTFSDEHRTFAVETRPDDPHSVTTIGFIHEGALHVPAQGASEKEWTHHVLADPRVRVKVGGRVFPARAVRVVTDDPRPYLESAVRKYTDMAPVLESAEAPPDDLWLFRIEPREG